MPAPLVPARPAFAADGTPYSEAYDDIYHSAAGGIGQARHVFLGGNGLPGRWGGRERFTLLETGFGLGLNFLVTWQAWRDDPRRCARLHFVSVEAHPFSADDLATLHAAYPELAPLSAELLAAWPFLVPGMHRLEFERGRVVLTLAFADAAEAVAGLSMAADAIFLDGFTPANNAAMWSRATLRAIARAAAPGATAATWSTAASVRGALEAAGFTVEKRAGYAGKREMTCARFGAADEAPRAPPRRRALVIGAGLAGGAACERLAARGWEITLLERRAAPAQETSGNHAGLFHPLVSIDDNLASRLTRAAFCWWLGHWRRLEAAGVAPAWSRCGLLQIARDDEESDAQRTAFDALGYPGGFARWVDQDEASGMAGIPVAAGGAWYEQAGWVRPAAMVNALLGTCGAALDARFDCTVASLERHDGEWIARDALGAEIARAPVVVLANAAEVPALAAQRHLALRRVRGQETLLPEGKLAGLRAVLLRGGYAIPPIAGHAVTGASFDIEDEDPAPRASSHAGNLERLERIVPGASAGLDPAALAGRVGFRAVARDRLPVVGALADDAKMHGLDPRAALPRVAGLYAITGFGSRGILWAGLAGELLASRLEGDALPVEAALADAVDPARFARRALRKGRR